MQADGEREVSEVVRRELQLPSFGRQLQVRYQAARHDRALARQVDAGDDFGGGRLGAERSRDQGLLSQG